MLGVPKHPPVTQATVLKNSQKISHTFGVCSGHWLCGLKRHTTTKIVHIPMS